jgi:hypothetical protein
MKTTTTTNDVRGNGNFWLIRQKSSSGGWKRDWQVKLSLPGSGKDRMESGRTFVPEACAICPECLAVPAGMSPTKVRPGCACTRGLRVFYERFLKQQRKAHALLVKEERFEEIEALVAPRAKMRFGEILPLIRENGPKGSRQVNAYALRNLVEGIFGGRLEEVAIEDLTWARIVDWARMDGGGGRCGKNNRAAEQQSSRAAVLIAVVLRLWRRGRCGLRGGRSCGGCWRRGSCRSWMWRRWRRGIRLLKPWCGW